MSTISIENYLLKIKLIKNNNAKNYEDYNTVYADKKFQLYPLILYTK